MAFERLDFASANTILTGARNGEKVSSKEVLTAGKYLLEKCLGQLGEQGKFAILACMKQTFLLNSKMP